MVLSSHLEYPADMYPCAYLKLELTSEYKALVRIDPELTKNGVRQGPSAVPFLLTALNSCLNCKGKGVFDRLYCCHSNRK